MQQLTSHARLALVARARGFDAPGTVVPTLYLGDRAWEVHGDGVERTGIQVTTDPGFGFDRPVLLILGYMYRDASNYKIHHRVRFAGRMQAADLDIILTALHGLDNAEGFFFPSDLGLASLPELEGWKVDYGDQDHPWHSLQEVHLSNNPPEGDCTPVSGLVSRARSVTRSGFSWQESMI